MNWASENANAILEAWYAGEEGGTAIAQTLAGVNNPAGRLPVTFYKGVEQLPAFENYSMAGQDLPVFRRPAPVSVRLWVELFEIRVQQLKALRSDD